MLKANSIRKGFYNNKPVKFFSLWILKGSGWEYAGTKIAPITIANKSLAKWAMENLQ